MSKFCTSCGAGLRPNSRYCVSCGSVAQPEGSSDSEATRAASPQPGTGTTPFDPVNDQTVLSPRLTQPAPKQQKPSTSWQPAIWIAGGAVTLVLLVIVVMLMTRSNNEYAAPAATVTATVQATPTPVPTPTMTVTAPPAPQPTVVAPAMVSCTSLPNTQLRYANVGGWQVCTTGTWGDGLARNAASRITGAGEYRNVPDKIGDMFHFSCFWVTADVLKCTGGNVKNNSPSGVESSLVLTRP